MGRGKKRKRALLKKKRLHKQSQGKKVPFTLSNCPKNLKGVTYRYVYKINVHHCSFSGAVFENVRYRCGHITQSSFKNAKIRCVDFISINLKNNKFKNATFSNCVFYSCNFENADFKNVTFKNVYFISCKLKNINNFFPTDEVHVVTKYPLFTITNSLYETLCEMHSKPKLEKYHILTMSNKKANHWMLAMLLNRYSEYELTYFFSKLLISNKKQYYTIFDYILSLQNYYKR